MIDRTIKRTMAPFIRKLRAEADKFACVMVQVDEPHNKRRAEILWTVFSTLADILEDK